MNEQEKYEYAMFNRRPAKSGGFRKPTFGMRGNILSTYRSGCRTGTRDVKAAPVSIIILATKTRRKANGSSR